MACRHWAPTGGIFALRHCDIDTKRRKFRLRGNNWFAYDGLCPTQQLAKVLCIALIILYDWWLLLVVVVVVLLLLPPSLTPSCPPEIGLPVVMTIPAPLALALAAAAVAADDGLSARRLQQQTPYRGLFPFVQAVLRFFLSFAGWNCPISPMPPSPQQWRQAFSSLTLFLAGSSRIAASSCGSGPSRTGHKSAGRMSVYHGQ